MKLLDNKIAIITGASRGIGKGIVRSFIDQGCSVAFTYSRNKEAAEDLLKEFSSKVKIKSSGFKKVALVAKLQEG